MCAVCSSELTFMQETFEGLDSSASQWFFLYYHLLHSCTCIKTCTWGPLIWPLKMGPGLAFKNPLKLEGQSRTYFLHALKFECRVWTVLRPSPAWPRPFYFTFFFFCIIYIYKYKYILSCPI